jgi:hypothetical protein
VRLLERCGVGFDEEGFGAADAAGVEHVWSFGKRCEGQNCWRHV